jgi:diguanylate cyclase (GGDEF)-like protein/PAS domain S-box-containing protein
MQSEKPEDLKAAIEALEKTVARLQSDNESVRLSEERYRTLFEALPVCLQIVDRDGTILEVNPFHLQHMGKGRTTLAEYQGRDITKRRSIVAAGLSREYRDVLNGTPFEKSEVLYPALSGGGDGYFNVRGVPLKKGSEIQGAIYILEDVTVLKKAKDELIRANGTLKARMDEIRQLQQDLREQAIRDPLTGLHNRRYLDETLDRELARAKREAYHVAFVMIDVDNFKDINDNHGHHAGDLVLKNLAVLLTRQTRASDLVCRLGGDEFVLVLPKVVSADALKLAEQYRVSFQESVAVLDGQEIKSTLSLGVALFPDQGATSRDVITAADRALYRSKRSGRNCIYG